MKENKVLLLFPKLHVTKNNAVASDSAMPLGIVNLAAKLMENSIPTLVIDQNKVNADFSYISNVIAREKITHMGISLSFPNPAVFPLIDKIKSYNPNVRIFLGGPLASYLSEVILTKNSNIDFIILGEGETPIVKVINADQDDTFGNKIKNELKSIKGFAFMEQEEYVNTGFNREDSIDTQVYSKAKLDLSNYNQVNLSFSKGCPFGCYFCLVTQYFGKKVLYADPLKLAEEIQYIVDTFNIRVFSFVDDTFGLIKDKLRTLVNEIVKRNLNSCYFWVGTRYDVLDDETIELFTKMGVKCVALGTESVNKHTRTELHKNNTLSTMNTVIKKLQEKKIRVETSAILGLPNETIADFKNTIDVLYNMPFNVVHLSTLIMIPGARLYDKYSWFGIRKVQEFSVLADYMEWDNYRINHGYYSSNCSTLEDLEKAYKYAYEKLNNRLVEKKFKEMSNLMIYCNQLY